MQATGTKQTLGVKASCLLVGAVNHCSTFVQPSCGGWTSLTRQLGRAGPAEHGEKECQGGWTRLEVGVWGGMLVGRGGAGSA